MPVLGYLPRELQKNELMCPQEKQTWYLPLFRLCIGLEKKWDFYVRKPSSRTPVCSCWANTRATDYKQAEGPTPGPGPYVTDPLLTSAFLFFPASSPLHQHTEAFQHSLREPRVIFTWQAWFSYPWV